MVRDVDDDSAEHQRWVRGLTNASVIIGVQKSGTTALGLLLRTVLGLRVKSHRKGKVLLL